MIADSPGRARQESAIVTGTPGPFACVSVLAIVTPGLRLRGLRFTKALAERLVARRRGFSSERAFIPVMVRRIDLAAAFFPGRARCLERSIALHVCLRWCGAPTVLRLGVQPYPFSAHAWVELDGEPVGDSPDSIALFRPLSLDNV
jgi:hypothetical protein